MTTEHEFPVHGLEGLEDPPIPEHVKLAVKKGTAFLDEHYPEWLDAIDLSKLQMDSAVFCILGQVEDEGNRDHYPYGYDVAVQKHGLEDGEFGEHLVYGLGFSAEPHTTWEQLQIAWEDQVRQLREERA